MITEDYCSYEVAKLFKEKGFDYQGFDYIDFEGEVIRQDRPTHQIAMKWLREVHHIFIRIIQSHLEYCSCEIYYDKVRCHNFMESFDSYEQAVETALKFSLENLI